jgi:FtsZ-binding cell division protein ZapB
MSDTTYLAPLLTMTPEEESYAGTFCGSRAAESIEWRMWRELTAQRAARAEAAMQIAGGEINRRQILADAAERIILLTQAQETLKQELAEAEGDYEGLTTQVETLRSEMGGWKERAAQAEAQVQAAKAQTCGNCTHWSHTNNRVMGIGPDENEGQCINIDGEIDGCWVSGAFSCNQWTAKGQP